MKDLMFRWVDESNKVGVYFRKSCSPAEGVQLSVFKRDNIIDHYKYEVTYYDFKLGQRVNTVSESKFRDFEDAMSAAENDFFSQLEHLSVQLGLEKVKWTYGIPAQENDDIFEMAKNRSIIDLEKEMLFDSYYLALESGKNRIVLNRREDVNDKSEKLVVFQVIPKVNEFSKYIINDYSVKQRNIFNTENIREVCKSLVNEVEKPLFDKFLFFVKELSALIPSSKFECDTNTVGDGIIINVLKKYDVTPKVHFQIEIFNDLISFKRNTFPIFFTLGEFESIASQIIRKHILPLFLEEEKKEMEEPKKVFEDSSPPKDIVNNVEKLIKEVSNVTDGKNAVSIFNPISIIGEWRDTDLCTDGAIPVESNKPEENVMAIDAMKENNLQEDMKFYKTFGVCKMPNNFINSTWEGLAIKKKAEELAALHLESDNEARSEMLSSKHVETDLEASKDKLAKLEIDNAGTKSNRTKYTVVFDDAVFHPEDKRVHFYISKCITDALGWDVNELYYEKISTNNRSDRFSQNYLNAIENLHNFLLRFNKNDIFHCKITFMRTKINVSFFHNNTKSNIVTVTFSSSSQILLFEAGLYSEAGNDFAKIYNNVMDMIKSYNDTFNQEGIPQTPEEFRVAYSTSIATNDTVKLEHEDNKYTGICVHISDSEFYKSKLCSRIYNLFGEKQQEKYLNKLYFTANCETLKSCNSEFGIVSENLCNFLGFFSELPSYVKGELEFTASHITIFFKHYEGQEILSIRFTSGRDILLSINGGTTCYRKDPLSELYENVIYILKSEVERKAESKKKHRIFSERKTPIDIKDSIKKRLGKDSADTFLSFYKTFKESEDWVKVKFIESALSLEHFLEVKNLKNMLFTNKVTLEVHRHELVLKWGMSSDRMITMRFTSDKYMNRRVDANWPNNSFCIKNNTITDTLEILDELKKKIFIT